MRMMADGSVTTRAAVKALVGDVVRYRSVTTAGEYRSVTTAGEYAAGAVRYCTSGASMAVPYEWNVEAPLVPYEW